MLGNEKERLGMFGHNREQEGTFGHLWQSLRAVLEHSKSIAIVSLEYSKSILKAQKLPSEKMVKVFSVILSGNVSWRMAGFAPLIGLN